MLIWKFAFVIYVNICGDIKFMTKHTTGYFWQYTIQSVCPLLLIMLILTKYKFFITNPMIN